MRVLIWHVHGSWTTAFVQGGHTYLVPVNAARDPYGRGRARTYPWPDTVREVPRFLGRYADLPARVIDACLLGRFSVATQQF